MSFIHELDDGWVAAHDRRYPTAKEKEEFYQSRRWQEIKENAQKRDFYKCRICEKNVALDGHHLTYERWGKDEEPRDILSLCRECHGKVHGKIKDPNDEAKEKEILEKDFNNHLAEVGFKCGCERCFYFWRKHQEFDYGFFVV